MRTTREGLGGLRVRTSSRNYYTTLLKSPASSIHLVLLIILFPFRTTKAHNPFYLILDRSYASFEKNKTSRSPEFLTCHLPHLTSLLRHGVFSSPFYCRTFQETTNPGLTDGRPGENRHKHPNNAKQTKSLPNAKNPSAANPRSRSRSKNSSRRFLRVG